VRFAGLFFALVFALTADAVAQQGTALEFGQRVRVTVPSLGVHGQDATFHHMRGDTLVLESMWCPIADVERLKVHAGRRSHPGEGALIGVVAGALIGIPVGVMERERYGPCTENSFVPCSGIFDPLVAIPIVFGVGGAVLGTFIGSLIRTDRWEEVQPERLRVQPLAMPDGRFGFVASVRF
jgi:hypothetical protein